MSEVVSLQNTVGEVLEDEDDLAYGDLGNGLIKRPSDIYDLESVNAHRARPRKGSTKKSFNPVWLKDKGADYDAAVFHCSRCNSLNDTTVKKNGVNEFASCSRKNSSEFNSLESNEELRQHLEEAVQEVDILRVELEASQRQLEGKEQALKILQSMAVLDRATSHTKAVFKKTELEKRALEKEINVLQWEIKLNQERFKNSEETWTEKYDRIYYENAALKELLKLKTEDVKTLRSENELLNQQHLEILAMLDVKQHTMAQETMSLSKSGFTEITGLELAVLGACTCSGPEGDPCSCAKMSMATRKQLLQLKQEFELLKKSKEEAYIMADAFRIAFEQQLMRRKDQALRLAQVNKTCKKETKLLNWKSLKEDGVLMIQGNRKSLGQKVMSMLASGTGNKKMEELDDPQEITQMLIDMLNDKEEVLAHQRKVSYMLARALEKKEESLQQQQGENKLSEEELALKINQYKKDFKSPKSIIPVCLCGQTCAAPDSSCSCDQIRTAQESSCCISSVCTVQHCSGTSKSSCSSTPPIMCCEENYVHEIEETN